jgi:hypothetical protein
LNASKAEGVSFRDHDVVAMTEAIVARAQGNYASVDDIANDVKAKLGGNTIGVIFPILSRNRFSVCLKGIAKGAKKIVLMLSYPSDEVGNHLISLDALDEKGVNPYTDVLTEDKYYELSETLSYTKKFLKGAPDKTFWLSFVTNLDELDSALRDENFFFSENLLMDREDVKILSKLSNEDKEEFYLSVMRVRINVNGKVYDPVEILIDESGVFGKYEITEEDISSSETLDVKIRFRIPQRDNDGYFFASISEPTFSPLIQFIYPEDAYDVTMIPFINRSVTAKEAKIFEGVRELSVENEWVIPVGGAIFLIEKNVEERKKALAL